MKYNYEKLTTELVLKKILDPKMVYDYSENEMKSYYEQFYQFCQQNLSEEWNEHNIPPTTIFFNFENSFNAFAKKYGAVNVIGINYILPYSLIHDFNDFDEKVNSYYLPENLTQIFADDGFSPSLLITQFSLLYIYYHELGHILQGSDNSNLSDENYLNQTTFDINSHLKEFDADLFSAERLAMHIHEYWLSHRNGEEDLNSLEILLSIGISGVFNFILHTFPFSEELYLRDKSHPHPVIRISYIIEFIIMAMEEILNARIINSSKVVKDAFELALYQVTNPKYIQLFINTFKNDNEEIKVYTQELFNLLKQSTNLSMSEKIN